MTVVAGEDAIVLRLEGEVASEASALLQRECARQLQKAKALVLDLKAVTLIDCQGAEALRRLRASGVRLINVSPLLEAVIRGCPG